MPVAVRGGRAGRAVWWCGVVACWHGWDGALSPHVWSQQPAVGQSSGEAALGVACVLAGVACEAPRGRVLTPARDDPAFVCRHIVRFVGCSWDSSLAEESAKGTMPQEMYYVQEFCAYRSCTALVPPKPAPLPRLVDDALSPRAHAGLLAACLSACVAARADAVLARAALRCACMQALVAAWATLCGSRW